MPETNPLPEGYHKNVTQKIGKTVDWSEPGLKVIRLRLVSDPGYPEWNISYCHGHLPDGTLVNVKFPFSDIPKLWKSWDKRTPPGDAKGIKGFLVDQARRHGIYAKDLGILDNISTLS